MVNHSQNRLEWHVTITHHFKETLIVGCSVIMQIIYYSASKLIITGIELHLPPNTTTKPQNWKKAVDIFYVRNELILLFPSVTHVNKYTTLNFYYKLDQFYSVVSLYFALYNYLATWTTRVKPQHRSLTANWHKMVR